MTHAPSPVLGERCLLFAFEESQDKLFRNAEAWGMDFAAAERDGVS